MDHEVRIASIEWHKVFAGTPVILAYLFGSHAEGRMHQGSDIDVAVLLEEGLSRREQGRWQMKLIGRLMDVLCTDEADLLILNNAPSFLRHRVIRPRRRLYIRDEKVRVDFEVQTMREWFDWRPHRERMERWWRQRILAEAASSA